jgi:ribosomal RNA-processing protein 9
MPDRFFASSKSRKRKRPASDAPTKGHKEEPARTPSAGPMKAAAATGKRRARADEELDSDQTSSDGGPGDDDSPAPRTDRNEQASGDEFAEETPAEKRLRLAKLYLESVREELGVPPSAMP